MKKVLVVLLLGALLVLPSCKKKMYLTLCDCCGEKKMCYEVSYHKVEDKSIKESHDVCSKDCEKWLDQLMALGGAVRD